MGGGKGGGLPPFAMPFGGGFGGYRGLTYAQPMFQPQPSFNLNQGPFGGGQFRRNFGTFNQGPFPLPQIANAYQGPMEPQQIQRVSAEDAYKQAQIEAQKARASGNMGRVVLPGEQSFEEFERNYNFPRQQLLEVVGARRPMNQGQVQLIGSQQDLRPELLKDVVPLTQQEVASFNRGNAFGNPFNRGNAFGGLGQLVRSGFFR